MDEKTADPEDFRTPRTVAALWFAVLAGPVAWMLGFNLDYALVRAACSGAGMLPLHAVTLLTLLLTFAGGWVAVREWRHAGEHWPDESPGAVTRSRFMVALALLGSPFFVLVILAQWVAKLFFNPCMGI